MTDVDVDELSLPPDVVAKLAELDLELSEGIKSLLLFEECINRP